MQGDKDAPATRPMCEEELKRLDAAERALTEKVASATTQLQTTIDELKGVRQNQHELRGDMHAAQLSTAEFHSKILAVNENQVEKLAKIQDAQLAMVKVQDETNRILQGNTNKIEVIDKWKTGVNRSLLWTVTTILGAIIVGLVGFIFAMRK